MGSGGNVTISGYSTVINSVNVAGAIDGSVVLSGGTLAINKGFSGGATVYGVTGSLTLNSGNLTFGAGTGTSSDNELLVRGNFNMSGGTVTSNNSGSLYLYGATNTITGGTFNATPITLESGLSNQSLSSSIALGNVTLGGAGNVPVTISDTASGTNIGAITLLPGQNSPVTILRLGSNLQSSGQLAAGSFGASMVFNYLNVDLAGHVLDISGASGNFAPGNNSANTIWTLESTGAQGTVKARGFTLSGATQTSVGAGTILEATAAGANDLGGIGLIDPNSSFKYTGTGTATLVSNRSIGGLLVQGGTLRTNQASLITAGATQVTGHGTLDLNGVDVGTLNVASFLVNGGTLALTLGLSADQIRGSGGSFDLTNLTLFIYQGSGFSTSDSYQVFANFVTGTAINDITTNISGYHADISGAGLLTFDPVAVPEPSSFALLGFALLTGTVLRPLRRQLAV